MKLILLAFIVFNFSHHLMANTFLAELVSDFELNECKKEEPVHFGTKKPISGDETCYLYNNNLYIENLIGNHAVEALRSNDVKKVFLNSVGGSISYAKYAAELIRDNDIETYVLADSYCASSCTLLFQAGVRRWAHEDSHFLYHCVGNNKVSLTQFKNQCGSDLKSLSRSCEEQLIEVINQSIQETKNHFEIYNKFDAVNIFQKLMDQDDYTDWFKTANFCKKRVILEPRNLVGNNVVTDMINDGVKYF